MKQVFVVFVGVINLGNVPEDQGHYIPPCGFLLDAKLKRELHPLTEHQPIWLQLSLLLLLVWYHLAILLGEGTIKRDRWVKDRLRYQRRVVKQEVKDLRVSFERDWDAVKQLQVLVRPVSTIHLRKLIRDTKKQKVLKCKLKICKWRVFIWFLHLDIRLLVIKSLSSCIPSESPFPGSFHGLLVELIFLIFKRYFTLLLYSSQLLEFLNYLLNKLGKFNFSLSSKTVEYESEQDEWKLDVVLLHEDHLAVDHFENIWEIFPHDWGSLLLPFSRFVEQWFEKLNALKANSLTGISQTLLHDEHSLLQIREVFNLDSAAVQFLKSSSSHFFIFVSETLADKDQSSLSERSLNVADGCLSCLLAATLSHETH